MLSVKDCAKSMNFNVACALPKFCGEVSDNLGDRRKRSADNIVTDCGMVTKPTTTAFPTTPSTTTVATIVSSSTIPNNDGNDPPVLICNYVCTDPDSEPCTSTSTTLSTTTPGPTTFKVETTTSCTDSGDSDTPTICPVSDVTSTTDPKSTSTETSITTSSVEFPSKFSKWRAGVIQIKARRVLDWKTVRSPLFARIPQKPPPRTRQRALSCQLQFLKPQNRWCLQVQPPPRQKRKLLALCAPSP
ncbi:hypothetical protein L596_003936 [Steinernema carpocapsae]|uniref:Uncharacterized protein n=1 Tax=Steinernema carpocapsae TaxID=34508 RepID=A0A4U8UU77_STECR|nr:hypothetical protein L596_003936 [Steinernema carpocapsae]